MEKRAVVMTEAEKKAHDDLDKQLSKKRAQQEKKPHGQEKDKKGGPR